MIMKTSLRPIIPLLVAVLLATVSRAADQDPGWAGVPAILARIVPPVFPDRDFPITGYGAVVGDTNPCTEAIAKAIEACAAAGGGRVVVPEGSFVTGPVRLKSNVNLHLAKGATLAFSTDPSLYLPVVPTRFEGMDCMNYSTLIYAKDQTNIAVTGEGTLDGQAEESNWLEWKAKTGAKSQRPARKRLDEMVNADVPPEQRVFGEGSYLRPNFIQFIGCRNVLIEGVRIRRSPMWEIHPLLCTNVTVRGVDITTHGANNDGCDPESCTDVLIENCLFDTGDDCIAIKSGRNNDGRRVGIPSSNIIVRKCVMKDGHGGVSIGSEISGGCRNVFIEDCEMSSKNLDRALRLKSNAMRGGVMENIHMRNVRVGTVKRNFLTIDFLYEEGANGKFMPVIRNVRIENVDVENAPRVVDAQSFPGGTVEGVTITGSRFRNVSKPDTIINADVRISGCEIVKSGVEAPAGKPAEGE
jgi:polygalacturonase